MISVACSTEQWHARFGLCLCRPLSSPSALQASCPAASKPAPCASPRAVGGGWRRWAVTSSVGGRVPLFSRDPLSDAEWLISAGGVAGCESGVKASCPPPVLAPLGEEAHGDSSSPRPLWLITLQPRGTLPGRGARGLCCALPSSPCRRKNVFKQSEVLFGCLYMVSELRGASPLSLTLEEALVSPALHWLSQNKLCFLAITFR